MNNYIVRFIWEAPYTTLYLAPCNFEVSNIIICIVRFCFNVRVCLHAWDGGGVGGLGCSKSTVWVQFRNVLYFNHIPYHGLHSSTHIHLWHNYSNFLNNSYLTEFTTWVTWPTAVPTPSWSHHICIPLVRSRILHPSPYGTVSRLLSNRLHLPLIPWGRPRYPRSRQPPSSRHHYNDILRLQLND